MSYSATVLADSPIAYYRLDDTNTTAVDSSGNGFNGTYSGTYTQNVTGLIAGDPDKATTFGGGDVANRPLYGGSAHTTGDFSWELWLKGSGNSGVVVLYGTDFWLGLNGGVPTYNLSLSGTTSIDDGAIHYVVLTRASGVLKIYVDGSVVATGGGGNTDAVGGTVDHIATLNGSSFHYSGTIDEFAIYNYALTSTQVSNHYSAGTSGGGGATTLTLTGPTSGNVNVASTNFTVTPDGTVSSDTVTPHTSGTGTFSPSSLTFTSSAAAQTFTYTPTTTSGSPHSISITDTASLTIAGSPISYTVNSGAQTVPVTDSHIFWGPGAWDSDGGGAYQANNIKASSTFARTGNPSNYLKFAVTSTGSGSIKLNLDATPLNGLAANTQPYLVWSINQGPFGTFPAGTPTANATVLSYSASPVQVTLATGLASGTYQVIVWVIGANAGSGSWSDPTTNSATVKITGVEIDAGSSMAAPTLLPKRAIVFGDSIAGGWYDGNGLGSTNGCNDATWSYAFMLAHALGAEVGIIAVPSQGYTNPGLGSTPAFPSAYSFFSSGRSRLVAGALPFNCDYVVVGQGTNDSADLTSYAQAAVGTMRTIAPAAWLFFLVPPGQSHASQIAAGVAAAGGSKAATMNTGINYTSGLSGTYNYSNDGIHLNPRGQALYASDIIQKVQAAIGGTTKRPRPRTVGD